MSKTIKTLSYLLIFTVVSILLTNCNSILLPKHQKVTFNTNSDENEVYLDDELVCKGKPSTTQIDKKVAKGQIVVLRKGYKPFYDVILRTKRPIAFYPLLILGLPTTTIALLTDIPNPKCKSFDRNITINTKEEESLLPIRKNDEKYIDITNIRIDIKDKSKDIVYIDSYHSDNLLKTLKLSENEYYANRVAEEKKIASLKTKQNIGKKLESSENELKIQIDETKYSDEILKTLKKTNYIDTVNKIFNDQNNTLVLEASIKKITHFIIASKWDKYWKTKLNITWYLKNKYNEILDSIDVTDYSGNFMMDGFITTKNMYYFSNDIKIDKYVGDAVLNSYINLARKKSFTDNIKLNKDFSNKEEKLQINRITNDVKVVNKSDAFKATVIVKSKENNKDIGHGSGFAISKDGYILTNYHVIAGKNANKQNEISVITATGQELIAKIVRFNKFRDVALLKIDYTFEKVFYLENQNKAEVMMDVLTIGAPKSIELGQSVSTGIISSIRDVNENKYLQLGMSINGGNSGGAIFDTNGNLHGIVVSKLVGYATEGVGFAIPSYLVADYLNLEVK